MIETPTSSPRGSCFRESEQVLSSGQLARWQEALATALEGGSGLDDAELVDSIRRLEQLVCTATAAQAQMSAELHESQTAQQAASGVPTARQGQGVAAQVALARRESHHRAQRHLGLARIVQDELPHTWTAWRTGRVTEWAVTLIARETACLSRDDRAAVDASVAADPDRLERMGLRAIVTACQQEAARLDPASVVSRRRRAEQDRHVSLRPAPDTMTRLSALLPVKAGVAVLAALSVAAGTARAAGDGRTRGQVMADALVESVLGARAASAGAATTWAGANENTQKRSSAPAATGVELNLVMSDLSLFGTSEHPAHLDGHGDIPAELARELVVGACAAQEKVWLRRLYTSPTSGELVSMDAHTRLFRGNLARFIRLRDQTCRTPWCEAPIRATDHTEDHGAGGPTSADNGQGLCEACNHAKQASGWRARPSPAPGGQHQVETTLPTGHTYLTRPPALATVREPPVRLDFVVAV